MIHQVFRLSLVDVSIKSPELLYEVFDKTREIGENIKSYIFDIIVKTNGIMSFYEIIEMTSSDISKFVKHYNEDYKKRNGIDEFSK